MREQIEALIQQARTARTSGRAAEARRGYGEAVDLARSAGDDALLAHALRHLSELDCEAGSAEAALVAGNEALALLRAGRLAKSLDLANALRVVALALGAVRSPEAVVKWQEAREVYAELDIPEGVAECDLHLRRGMSEMGK